MSKIPLWLAGKASLLQSLGNQRWKPMAQRRSMKGSKKQ